MAWDGYISGKNIGLKPGRLIKQYWRTSEFKPDQPDSILEITIQELDEQKTRITLHHYNLTEEDIHYKQGWIDHYFEPMTAYFGQLK